MAHEPTQDGRTSNRGFASMNQERQQADGLSFCISTAFTCERWNPRAALRESVVRTRKPTHTTWTKGEWTSGRNVIDDNVDQAVVPDEISGFAERIAAAGHRIARARNPRNDLYFLPCGERSARHHGIRGCQFHRLWKSTRQPLRGQRWAWLAGIPYEHEERRRIGSGL